MFLHRFKLLCDVSLEATTLTEPPEDTEVMVGDEVVLRCAASYDPMLDIAFIWAIDFRVIDFDAEWQHYERVLVGWRFILQESCSLVPFLSFTSLSLLADVQSDDGSGDLRIKNVQIWHEGRYTCTAQTVVDSDTTYADLKVVGQSHLPCLKRS